MKESYGEGVAIHTGPESYAVAREGGGEALTRETGDLRPPGLHAQLRENAGGEVHRAAADDAQEAACEAEGGQGRASATHGRSHPGAGRTPGRGPEGPLPLLRGPHERSSAERLPVGRRVDLVPKPKTARSASPHQLASHARSGLPAPAVPAHLSSVSTRAPRRCDPRWEPDAVAPHVRICAGGAGRPASLPRQDWGGLQGTAVDSRGLGGATDSAENRAPATEVARQRTFLLKLDAGSIPAASTK